MTVAELKTALKNGSLAGVYLFCGEENFLKRHYVREMRRTLLPDPTFDAFNHLVYEGEKIDFLALTEAVQAPPMMAERKLVEWHLGDFGALRENGLSQFADLCHTVDACPETVLLFSVDADRLDIGSLPRRPSKLYTTLSKTAHVVCFERSGEAALSQWIARHFAHEGVSASPAVIAALLAQSGTGMDALSGEIEKLTAYAKANGRDEITCADVETVASRVEESDAFGLSNALLAGDAAAAYTCLLDMKRRRVEASLALAAVSRTYADLLAVAACMADGAKQKDIAVGLSMHEYKAGLYMKAASAYGSAHLQTAMELCRRADTATKTGTGIGGYLALEYLIARLLGGGETEVDLPI